MGVVGETPDSDMLYPELTAKLPVCMLEKPTKGRCLALRTQLGDGERRLGLLKPSSRGLGSPG